MARASTTICTKIPGKNNGKRRLSGVFRRGLKSREDLNARTRKDQKRRFATGVLERVESALERILVGS